MKRNAHTASAPAALVALAFFASLLALFQWMELLVIQAGGKTVCGLSDVVSCEAVWKSPLALWVHATLRVPVAGFGLVWGLAAFFLSLRLLARRASGTAQGGVIAAVRLTGVVGALSCVGLGVASALAKVVCLTCLGTYALVIVFALVALFALPRPILPERVDTGPALGWSLGAALIAYLMVVGPGMATPLSGSESALPTPPIALTGGVVAPAPAKTAAVPKESEPARSTASALPLDSRAQSLANYLATLPAPHQQAIADALAKHKASKVIHADPPRAVLGPASAPVKIVEFTDIVCGHCRELVRTMSWLKKMTPPGAFSVEARQFPLDGTCNPAIPHKDSTGLRCFGGKVFVCLETAPDYWDLREKIFLQQASLTRDKVVEIATSSGTVKKAELLTCVDSPATDAKIKADVMYAMRANPEGTPVVFVNGRVGTPVPGYLFGMVMTGANADSPAFGKLPPPRKAGDAHAGHNHGPGGGHEGHGHP